MIRFLVKTEIIVRCAQISLVSFSFFLFALSLCDLGGALLLFSVEEATTVESDKR